MTKIDEATVRACIEALPYPKTNRTYREALEALLPKPVYRAAELVEKFRSDETSGGGKFLGDVSRDVELRHYTRWLLDNLHLIQPRKEWSKEEISDVAEEEIPDFCNEMVTPLREVREDRIRDRVNAILRRGIEMGRQLAPVDSQVDPFQQRVRPWMDACFGPEISSDKLERSDRFIEEALELVQSGDYPKDRVLALVDYVYGRPVGEMKQEVGGVMVTLAAYCLAHDIDMHDCGEVELARIWTKVEQIRAKQAAKPIGSALPIAAPDHTLTHDEIVKEAREWCSENAIKNGERHNYRSGDYDGITTMKTAIAILTAWKGEK